MNFEKEMLDYLQQVDKMTHGRSLESVVLKYGQAFATPVVARPNGIRKGPNGECFRTAFRIAEDYKYTYVEGFAMRMIAAAHQHAWCLDPHGQVVETTWSNAGQAYYGIVFDLRTVRMILLDTKVYGVLNYSSKTFRDKFGL